MAKRKRRKLSDEAKMRFGGLSVVLSAIFVGLGTAFFLSSVDYIEGLNMGPNASVFGWYAMVLGLFLAGLALAFGVTMSNAK